MEGGMRGRKDRSVVRENGIYDREGREREGKWKLACEKEKTRVVCERERER